VDNIVEGELGDGRIQLEKQRKRLTNAYIMPNKMSLIIMGTNKT
jgi:hypothetical protein